MKHLSRRSPTILLSLVALLCLAACQAPFPPGPQPLNGNRIGEVTRIMGTGEVRINNRAVGEGATMESGDHIETVGDARAVLSLARGGRILFDADTDPVLEWLSSAYCKLRILINVGSILVDAPCETTAETGSGAVIETLKTIFHLRVTWEMTELTVIRGKMRIRGNVGPAQVVSEGFFCRVIRDRPAPPPVRVNPAELINWACLLDRSLCREAGGQRGDVSVPNLMDTDLKKARRILSRYRLKTGRVRETATPLRSLDGLVTRQSPEPGTRVPRGSTVDLHVGQYRPAPGKMPMVLNLPLKEAEKVLQSSGVRLGRITETNTTDPDRAGRVARQSPGAGQVIRTGQSAGLAVYRYVRPPTRKTPRLTGLHVDRAREALGHSGLKLGRTHKETTDSRRKIGIVFRQRPSAGSAVQVGSRVDVWVYTKKPPQPSILINPGLQVPILRIPNTPDRRRNEREVE